MAAGEGEPTASSLASHRVQQILEAAEASAAAIRAEAEADAEAIRERAGADARRTAAAIEAVRRRLEEVQGELGALAGALGAEQEPAPAPAAEPARAPAAEPAPAPAAEPAPAPARGDDDGAGVRLIALNMALDGTPREQTARFLAENFTLADPGRLLDEVYASVDG